MKKRVFLNWSSVFVVTAIISMVPLKVLGEEANVSQRESQASLQEEELSHLSMNDPFEITEVEAVDPVYHQKYDQVLTGPAFQTNMGNGFDYYRYVTFYNIGQRKERIHELPIQKEECNDKSDLFASYSFSYSYSATVKASASVEGLGLETSMTASKTITTGRNIRAEGNMIATHTPYFLKQDWSGLTFVQTYNSSTKKFGFITDVTKESSVWVKIFFPLWARAAYPMEFEVKDADWIFDVERTIIKQCQ